MHKIVHCGIRFATMTHDIAQVLSQGVALHKAGRLTEAASQYRRVLQQAPDHSEALHLLGMVQHEQGVHAEAVENLRRAVALSPNRPTYLYNLGVALLTLRQPEQAIDVLTAAVRLAPQEADIQNNLGNALSQTGRLVDACNAYQAAARLNPERAELHHNIGTSSYKCGRIEAAIAAFQNAVRLKPSFWQAHSNCLLALNNLSRADRGLLDEHRAWGIQHAEPLTQRTARPSSPRPSSQRLRIGYVSADFRSHAAMSFFGPILTHHDRSRFEVCLYSNVQSPDPTTQHVASLAERWRDISTLSDDDAAELIQRDQIDLLLDLSGHTGRHRLLVFTRKPAPIQLTYLGYPNTTGVSAIDYRLCDPLTDPPGQTESFHTERLIRLPGCFLCYRPLVDSLDLEDRPARPDGSAIVFGSFNNFSKISPQTLDLWSAVLRRVEGSRLRLKADALSDPMLHPTLRSEFARRGVDGSRIDLTGWAGSFREHLEAYRPIDIALDTFPYQGTTTTCESLWMGVPVVVLAGGAHVSRVGVSLLSAVGIEHLIAHSPEQYVQIAATLAQDFALRKSVSGQPLRLRMEQSPLMAAPTFVAGLEQVYGQLAAGRTSM